jgi:RHS repeat-associated protein
VAYTYDALNRLISITYPDATGVSYNYDANGNLVSMLDSIGATGNSYDALNRLDATRDPFGNKVGYVYDPAGNLVELTYPDDTVVTYAFDDANRLASVTDWAGRIVTYSYDNAGKLVRADNPNGTLATYTYDAAVRLRGLSNKKQNNEVICSYNYTLDPVGNRVAVDKIEPLVPFIKTETINYQYDADNRIVSITNGAFAFDANGSVIQKTEGVKTYNYEWNYENYLKGWGDGVHTSTYGYDGLKRRLTAVRNGVATRYVLDTHGELPYVLAETDSTGAIKARYIYGIGLIAREDSSGVKYYHYDPLGSTIALSNDAGIVADKYAYDPFGMLSNRYGSSSNHFLFLGRHGLLSESNQMYFVRSRYYDSAIGRFLQKDIFNGRLNDPISLQRYIYAKNDPVDRIDISGFCSKKSNLDSWWYKYTNWAEDLEDVMRNFGPILVGTPTDAYTKAFGVGMTAGFVLTDTIMNEDKKTNLLKLLEYGNWCGPKHGGGVTLNSLDSICMPHDIGEDINTPVPYNYIGKTAHERDLKLRVWAKITLHDDAIFKHNLWPWFFICKPGAACKAFIC